MRCNKCNVEMMIDSVNKTENSETFNFKCPNPKCENYGYGGAKDGENEHKDE